MIAFIPARGDSTRFPRKNLALLDGRPLIEYTIAAAFESGVFNCICVSSEDDEIISLALRYFNENTLLEDRHIMRSVIRQGPRSTVAHHCAQHLDAYAQSDRHYDTFAVLLPTSPLRTAADIRSAYDIFTSSRADVCMSLTEFEHQPQWAVSIGDDGYVVTGPDINRRREELSKAYRHDGGVIFAKTKPFMRTLDFYAGDVVPYFIPAERAVDVNTEMDLMFAEFLLKNGDLANA